MEKESRLSQYHWEVGKFPDPSQVLQASLAKIGPDGRVEIFDEDESHFWKPNTPVPLETLPADVYELHMLQVARSIMGRCVNIACSPEDVEGSLQTLAIYLTGYRHDPEFLEKCADLIRIDEKGFLYNPQLPRKRPSRA